MTLEHRPSRRGFFQDFSLLICTCVRESYYFALYASKTIYTYIFKKCPLSYVFLSVELHFFCWSDSLKSNLEKKNNREKWTCELESGSVLLQSRIKWHSNYCYYFIFRQKSFQTKGWLGVPLSSSVYTNSFYF